MTATDMVKSILEDISIKVYQGSEYGQRPAGKTHGRPVVLLCGSDFETAKVLKGLEAASQGKSPLALAITRSGEQFYRTDVLKSRPFVGTVLTEGDHASLDRWLKQAPYVWCPNVTQATLVKLATGLTDSLGACLLWRALTLQKPVTLTVNAAAHWTAALPEVHPMRKLLDGHLKAAEAYGAFLTTEYGPSCAAPEAAAEPAVPSGVRLIHEGNLVELAGPQKKLAIVKGQLITPAARDLAGARGIELIWK